jgi:hypothetical protein
MEAQRLRCSIANRCCSLPDTINCQLKMNRLIISTLISFEIIADYLLSKYWNNQKS